MIPPIAAETITTTKSEISLHGRKYYLTISDKNIKHMQLGQAFICVCVECAKTLDQLVVWDTLTFYLTSQTYCPAI